MYAAFTIPFNAKHPTPDEVSFLGQATLPFPSLSNGTVSTHRVTIVDLEVQSCTGLMSAAPCRPAPIP